MINFSKKAIVYRVRIVIVLHAQDLGLKYAQNVSKDIMVVIVHYAQKIVHLAVAMPNVVRVNQEILERYS